MRSRKGAELALAAFSLFALLAAGCGGLGPSHQRATPKEVGLASIEKQPSPTPVASPGGAAQAEEPRREQGRLTAAVVTRAVDGDTVDVRWVAGPKLPASRVRLIGVDAPESTTQVEPFGKEAAAFTRERLEGKRVWLEKDVSETDRYGRALRYLWLAEPPPAPSEEDVRRGMFNAVLLLEGYANAATFPPDVRWSALFVRFEREAREARRGLWSLDAGGAEPQGKGAASSKPARDYDCSDFRTQAEAQRVFEQAGGPERDPYRLDADRDGVALREPAVRVQRGLRGERVETERLVV